jgi:sporulation protein YlmC with PRC-barrel domain
MRLGELYGMMVRGASGERLGRVHEVYAKDGEVEALGIGAANLLERLLGHRHGRRIAWAKVRKVAKGRIIVEE